MKYVILFLSMVFLHIFDDYVLQNALARLKQKSTWEEYVKETPIYKNDYKMALFEHALEWTLVVHSPFMVYAYIHNSGNKTFGRVEAVIARAVADRLAADGGLKIGYNVIGSRKGAFQWSENG